MVQKRNNELDLVRAPAHSTGEFLEQIRGFMRMRRFSLNTGKAQVTVTVPHDQGH